MKRETVEYQKFGNVKMTRSNLLIGDIIDMELLEYWEHRLEKLKQPFAVTFKKKQGVIVYQIYTNLRTKKSAFKASAE